jgi:hypothetical protein
MNTDVDCEINRSIGPALTTAAELRRVGFAANDERHERLGRLREWDVERRRNFVADVSDRDVADQADDPNRVLGAEQERAADWILSVEIRRGEGAVHDGDLGRCCRIARIEHPAAQHADVERFEIISRDIAVARGRALPWRRRSSTGDFESGAVAEVQR